MKQTQAAQPFSFSLFHFSLIYILRRYLYLYHIFYSSQTSLIHMETNLIYCFCCATLSFAIQKKTTTTSPTRITVDVNLGHKACKHTTQNIKLENGPYLLVEDQCLKTFQRSYNHVQKSPTPDMKQIKNQNDTQTCKNII